MSRILDISGHKYGLLTVLHRTEQRSGTSYKWYCICDCGNYACVASNNLRTGHIDNCGCLTKSRRSKAVSKHGMTNSSEYQCWQNMKSRCLNKEDSQYPYYGGRGIKVQESWLNDFSEFIRCVGKKPFSNYTLDRIDNDGDYCTENVRWTSREHQAKNRGKFKNNTTGITGVNLGCKNGNWYYIAVWVESGKQTNRVFSVNKHGLLPAMAKAIKVRQERLEWLKKNDDYSEKHGEPRKEQV